MLEYYQLIYHKDPKIKKIETISAANEFRCLFQGYDYRSKEGKRNKGINIFYFIHCHQVSIKKLEYYLWSICLYYSRDKVR